MINYVIIEKGSRSIQEDINGMLCIFVEKEKAERFLRMAGLRSKELELVECKIIKPE